MNSDIAYGTQLTIKKCIKDSLTSTDPSRRKCFVEFYEIRGIYLLDFPEFPKGTQLCIDGDNLIVTGTREKSKSTNQEELSQLFSLYQATKDFICYKDIRLIWICRPKECYTRFQANPYSLFFETVYPKEIQEQYGFCYYDLLKHVSPTTFATRREEIGFCFVEELREEENSGNTYLEYDILAKRVASELMMAGHSLLKQELDLTPFLNAKCKSNALYCDTSNFHLRSPVFRRETYDLENNIYNAVKALVYAENRFRDIPMVDNGMISEEQNGAVSDIITSSGNINILTGGPGTGKTTIINEILRRVMEYDSSLNIAIVAPTGRAAKRAEETIEYRGEKLIITTVHKFVGYGNPCGDDNNVKDVDLIIIDESSMLTPYIFHRLLYSMNLDYTKLVLVGDVDQLPSIDPGDILADLIRLGVPTSYLTQNYRSAEVIVENSILIKQGLLQLHWTPTFQLVDTSTIPEQDLMDIIIHDFADCFFRYDQRGNESGVVISPYAVNDIVYSTHQANKLMHYQYDQNFSHLPKLDQYRYGEPVIITKTNYRAGIPYFNGEMGKVVACRVSGVCVDYEIAIDDRTVIVPSQHLRLAYSITVHKSQGSEYDDVFFVAPKHTNFVTRKLFYTAITRAKRSIKIYSTMDVLKCIIANVSDAKRRTLLKLKDPF